MNRDAAYREAAAYAEAAYAAEVAAGKAYAARRRAARRRAEAARVRRARLGLAYFGPTPESPDALRAELERIRERVARRDARSLERLEREAVLAEREAERLAALGPAWNAENAAAAALAARERARF